MEHLDHENLPLCLLSTFLTYHGRTCLLLLSVLLPVFQIVVTQPYTETDKASGNQYLEVLRILVPPETLVLLEISAKFERHGLCSTD